jgi:hypothetical protein
MISLAVQGAVAGRHEALVRGLLAGLPDGTTREELLDRVVPDAPLSWEPWLVPALRDAYGARALAAYAARHPPEHATELLTVALEVATPWDRRAILSNHHELAGAIPSDRLWDLWVRALGNTDSRRNVLGEIEAWAPVLIAAFGPAVAVALDDVITLLATDEWPTSRPG